MIVGSGLICYTMAVLFHHTAAFVGPHFGKFTGVSMRENLLPLGGVETLLIGIAIGSSLAMVLPISTPPNAGTYHRHDSAKDMEKVGIIMGIMDWY